MSIRHRTILLIVIVTLALTGALYILLDFTALQRFDRLEEEFTRKQVVRVEAAVESISSTMIDAARDYAVWDQTYEFTQHPSQEYIDSNFSTSCESLRVNFAIVVDLEGNNLFSIAYDINSGEYSDPPPELLNNPDVISRLLTPNPDDGEAGGLVLLPSGPMVVGAAAVRPESGSTLIGGIVAFGKYLDEEMVKSLEEQQQANFTLTRLDAYDQTPPAARDLLENNTDRAAVAIEATNNSLMNGYALIVDISGQPALLLTVTEPRVIHQQRHWVARIATLGLVLVLGFFSLLLLAFLESMLIQPLSRFVEQVKQTGIDGDHLVLVKLTEQGPSEIRRLARAVNHMLDRIDRAQQAVNLTQQRFQSLADNVPVMIWSTDADLRVDYRNLLAQSFSGDKPESDAVDLMSQAHPEDVEQYRQAFEDALASRQRMRAEVRFRRQDGEYRWMLLSGTGLFDEPGRLTGTLSTALDITDDKLRALQIERYAHELEQKNHELDEALVSARAADEAKSAFLAVMSHEIRTPLNGVVGILELLAQTPLSNDQADLTRTAAAAADSLLAIINDILDFSKIEARRVELEQIDFDLRYVLESAADTLGAKAFQRGLELLVQLERNVPRALVGDPGRLRQILLNLIGNALKFTEEGEIVVLAELVSDESTEVELRFSIRDTGIGIPSDRQGLLFQSFSQVDASTTRKYGGTGLGLAICRQLAEMMGGQIGVDSAPGAGSTFWFTARLKKQARPQPLEPAPDEELVGLPVLVVDDNSTNLTILEHQLRDWGCEVSLTTSSEQGLQMLQAAAEHGRPFKLAVVDLLMPEMSGEGFARAVRNNPQIKDILLVLMTSSGQRGDAEQMSQAGFNAYLVKPVKQALLHECLLVVLGATRADDPALAPLITRHILSERRQSDIRVLLAEDNVVNQKVATRMLRNSGYEVTVAPDGQAAVEAIQQAAYDIVLMDIHMPRLDGYQATAAIRALGGDFAKIPIVAMTANVLPEEVQKTRQAGMNGYLSKPVKSHELMAEIERQVAAADSPRPTRAEPAAAAPSAGAGPAAEQRPAQPAPDDPHAAPASNEWREASQHESLSPVPLDINASIRQTGDAEFWRELISVYLDETSVRIQDLQSAITAGNAALTVRHAHTIKGGSAELAAEGMRSTALAIEQAAKGGDLRTAAKLLPRLEATFAGLRHDVQAFLARQ